MNPLKGLFALPIVRAVVCPSSRLTPCFLYASRRLGQAEKARKYSTTRLTSGTTMRRLNHLEYPAFEKMNQKGRMIKTAKIKQMTNPKGPICIGMSCMMILSLELE